MMLKELLVVDDEVKVTRALKAFFEQKGIHVTTAATAKSALDHLAHVSADAVMLDVKLPDRSGLDVLPLIKEQFPDLRVVVISALADHHTIATARELGASDYLTKPFDFSRCFYAAMGIETVDLTTVQADAEALARLPHEVATHARVLPIRMTDGELELAMLDPLDVTAIRQLETRAGCRIKPLAIVRGDLDDALTMCYPSDSTAPPIRDEPTPKRTSDAAPPQVRTPPSPLPAESSMAALTCELLRYAHDKRATGLSLGLDAQGPWVRLRIDGQLQEAPAMPQLATHYGELIAYLKSLASLDPDQRWRPQHGRVMLTLDATPLDVRLSFLPTPRGESVAIRLLEPGHVLSLDQVGLTEEQHRHLTGLLAKPTGLWLVTGPSGSGKSTTLYAILAHLNTGRANIVTIEKSVEQELHGVTQMPLHPANNLTHADAVRALLWHDPDIIMADDIPDQDTAHLLSRAALTQRLVISTLPTPNAATAITRLLDLDVEPFVLCSSLSVIIAQRLLHRLCERCRTAIEVDVAQLAQMGMTVPAKSGAVRLWRAVGCPACGHSGYCGWVGAFEVLAIDHHLRSLILKRAPSAQLAQSAASRGMHTLIQSGWEKARQGLTSLDEFVRVLSSHPRS